MINTIIGLFVENWAEISGILAALILVFDRLAKLTPTNSDNQMVELAQRIFSILGVRVQDNPGKSTAAYQKAAEEVLKVAPKVDRAVK